MLPIVILLTVNVTVLPSSTPPVAKLIWPFAFVAALLSAYFIPIIRARECPRGFRLNEFGVVGVLDTTCPAVDSCRLVGIAQAQGAADILSERIRGQNQVFKFHDIGNF